MSNGNGNVSHLNVTAEHAPVTFERPYRLDTDQFIEKPFVARASYAPSVEHPSGTVPYARKHKDWSVMQQHVMFWDRDGDGEIWPLDTFIGFRELGFNILFCLFAVFVINGTFSFPSRLAHSYLPDPFFRVYVSGIHKDKHGSDTGVYDNEGRFIPSRFEDIFTKYASATEPNLTTPATSLNLREVYNMTAGQRLAVDPFGWGAAIFEWSTTCLLIQKDGRVEKDDLRRLYDGSLFYEIRGRRQSGEGWNKGWGLGGDGFIGGEKVLPFGL
ncbi:Caleosin-domain-containing protein [Laetiporus sulphureus 93-53]|uniref:Caleosin-domain-containing protein n=1 Tax=Laetiporus sulphureus 93-53 TaxID=1314785 RepID=A0A165CSQ5_9APHY|nr:Caleosin-domain-containing protein [Laetiporus sulphureus 93-53]KZT03370.1 Caleosin-domain-containing protein [Laetiporus sulphureus 93-53]